MPKGKKGRQIIRCKGCGKTSTLHGKGKCSLCYKIDYNKFRISQSLYKGLVPCPCGNKKGVLVKKIMTNTKTGTVTIGYVIYHRHWYPKIYQHWMKQGLTLSKAGGRANRYEYCRTVTEKKVISWGITP